MVKNLRPMLVRLYFSAQMAGHGIMANPLRSILTILGVAIGVASVVSLMSIGEGARQEVVKQFESLGSNVIVVKSADDSVKFEPELAEELVERVQGLDMATPVVSAQTNMRWRRTRGMIEIIGANHNFPEIRDHELISGHFFTSLHVKQRSPVAVLGYNIAANLMGGRSPVGQTMTLDGRTYRIIGVLAPKGAGSGEGIDDKVVIPYTAGLQIAKTRTVGEIWGKAHSGEEADLVMAQLGRIFRRRLGLDQSAPTVASLNPQPAPEGGMMEKPMPPAENGGSGSKKTLGGKDLLTITSLNKLVKEADQANRVMTLLLGGIAAVSLLVGGLGIMNIMLVAVTERTKEIGIRRALGAKQVDLLIQFLLEALYLSGIGAIAGIALGLWGVNLFGHYGFATAVSFQAIEISTGVALGAGLLFGVYPAISASSVPPVEALRR